MEFGEIIPPTIMKSNDSGASAVLKPIFIAARSTIRELERDLYRSAREDQIRSDQIMGSNNGYWDEKKDGLGREKKKVADGRRIVGR